MSKNTKLMLAVFMMLSIVTSISFAGAKINAWVIDDFESYSSTEDLQGSSLEDLGVKPWWLLQDIEAALGLGEIPEGNNLSLELVSDPNAFIASGEIDGGQGLEIHYDLQSGFSCDLFMMSNNIGLPFSMVPTGQPAPLDFLPVVDFSSVEKVSIKVKRSGGNNSTSNSFGMTLIGPDLVGIFTLNAKQIEGQNLMEYPPDSWETLDFYIQGEVDPGESAFDMTMVTGFVIGTYDNAGSDVTYVVDDIMLYNKSVPCASYSAADINLDCAVDMLDFAMLAADWLSL